jgi:predicted acyltransferase
MHTSWRIQALVILVILIGYWAAATFVPVPGFGAGVLTPEGMAGSETYSWYPWTWFVR